MLVNGNGATAGEWTVEKIFAGERLHCYLQVELAEAIDLAVSQVAEMRQLSMREITEITTIALMETAMRQVMAAKMPCTLAEFEAAARLVYLSCHQHDDTHGDARRQ
jgi:hypothetical protein